MEKKDFLEIMAKWKVWHNTQYFAGAPLAMITAAMERDME